MKPKFIKLPAEKNKSSCLLFFSTKFKKFFYKNRYAVKAEQGQSLVEMSLVLPVLLLMMLGVLEVGWALRGYLTLVNANREVTRFASRGVYLDFDSTSMSPTSSCFFDAQNDPAGVGYCKVISHATSALALDSVIKGLGTDFLSVTPNSSVIITYYDITPAAEFDCQGDSTCAGFDCSRFLFEHPNYVAGENLANVQYPVLTLYDPLLAAAPNVPDFYNRDFGITNTTALTAYHYHRGGSYFSQINPVTKTLELRGEVNQLNCKLTQKGFPPTGDNLILIENVFAQDQLVGFPFINTFVPDPIPMYSHTAMRVTTDLREAPGEASGCELYPIVIRSGVFGGVFPGDEITIPIESGSPHIPGNFGFVTWEPGDASEQALEDNIEDPSNATTLYQEPEATPVDNILNIGDYVSSGPGSFGNSISAQMADLAAKGSVIFPVWDDSVCDPGINPPTEACEPSVIGTGNNARFRVLTYVKMDVTSYQLTGGNKGITFEFSEFVPGACGCDEEEDGAACDLP